MKKTMSQLLLPYYLAWDVATILKKLIFSLPVIQGAKVSFSAVINNHEASNLVTRATETNWEAEDSVGITCGTEQVNIHYKYKGNGLFAAKRRKCRRNLGIRFRRV